MRTFASLFSGGGGADIGAIAAGLKPIWGVELKPEIAEWYVVNIGHPAIVGDVCGVDFSQLESPFWLHMSPPCVTASVANAKAGEGDTDRALAAACVRAIEALRPEWVSLENVGGYQSYESYAAIKNALTVGGYRFVEDVLNAANYGVPQTRRRLFLIASRTATPALPRPTHSDKEGEQMQLSMFDAPLLPWVGWYKAIADLIPTLPESRLAKWQLERLPEDLRRFVGNGGDASVAIMADSGNSGARGYQKRGANDPALTVVATMTPKAILMSAENTTSAVSRDAVSPAMAIRAGIAEHNSEPRALLMPHNGQYAEPRDGEARSLTISAEHGERARLRALLYAPNRSSWESANNPALEDEPAPTLRANGESCGYTKAIVGCRVVRLTVEALGRLMGFPRSYKWPTDRRLGGRIAGNAVCPPMMTVIIKAQPL